MSGQDFFNHVTKWYVPSEPSALDVTGVVIEPPSSSSPETEVCTRNIHAVITLLRVVQVCRRYLFLNMRLIVLFTPSELCMRAVVHLQKLTKGRKTRVLALVGEKSVLVLKRCLGVNNPFVQLYCLKVFRNSII